MVAYSTKVIESLKILITTDKLQNPKSYHIVAPLEPICDLSKIVNENCSYQRNNSQTSDYKRSSS